MALPNYKVKAPLEPKVPQVSCEFVDLVLPLTIYDRLTIFMCFCVFSPVYIYIYNNN